MIDPVSMKLNMDPLLLAALREDISSEDISTIGVMPGPVKGEAELICKQDGVICGMPVFGRVFWLLDPKTEIEYFAAEGAQVRAGERLARVRGDMRVILSGERTALNYLQRMSGIAAYTRETVRQLEGSRAQLVDTRKTTPNNRIFEKYAVRVGGGGNHRINLSDGVLLKDNHIGAAGGVRQAVEAVRRYAPFVRKIEVECETLEMVSEAIEAGADIIMLDNMDYEAMRRAVKIIGGQAEIEASGRVNRENIALIAGLGVDYISCGALTHSAPILDVSLKNLHPI